MLLKALKHGFCGDGTRQGARLLTDFVSAKGICHGRPSIAQRGED